MTTKQRDECISELAKEGIETKPYDGYLDGFNTKVAPVGAW